MGRLLGESRPDVSQGATWDDYWGHNFNSRAQMDRDQTVGSSESEQGSTETTPNCETKCDTEEQNKCTAKESTVVDNGNSSKIEPLHTTDYNEAQSYVDSVMTQPFCNSVTATPTANRRKRYLSAPSVDSTMKKRKNGRKSDKGTTDDDSCREVRQDSSSDSDISSGAESNIKRKGRRRILKPKREQKSESRSDSNNMGTEVVLKAVRDLQASIDKRFDEMKTESQSVVKQLQDQIGKVREEFNSRMDGLTKKVETKVTQNVRKAIDDKVKGIKKDLDSELTRVKNHIKETEKGVLRVKETIIPILDERIADELEEIRNKVEGIEKGLKEQKRDSVSNMQGIGEDTRIKNIIIRNFPERLDEDIKKRVHYMIRDTLNLKNIRVVEAVRLPNKNRSNPGIVKATLDSKESKQLVMQHKKKLKDSTRYCKAFIENDVPAAQRAINANFRAVLHALGESNLQLRGSRISSRHDYQQRSEQSYTDHSINTGSYDIPRNQGRVYGRQYGSSDNRSKGARHESRY